MEKTRRRTKSEEVADRIAAISWKRAMSASILYIDVLH